MCTESPKLRDCFKLGCQCEVFGAQCWKRIDPELCFGKCRLLLELCCLFIRGDDYNSHLFISSEDQDELHYHDTDQDVPEQRDGRCKVKWTQEEVSESLALAESRYLEVGLWHGIWGLGASTPVLTCQP